MKLILYIFILIYSCVSVVNAKITHTEMNRQEDQDYIVTRIPYKHLISNKRKLIVKKTLDEVSKLFRNKKNAEFSKGLKLINEKHEAIFDSLEKQIVNSNRFFDSNKAIHPTAFSFFVGGNISAAFGLAGNVNVSIGLIVLPVVVIKTDKRSGKKEISLEIDTSWVFFPEVGIGVGAGGGVSLRAGIGFIWGPLSKASNFRGPQGTLNGTCSAGIGIAVKCGYLCQTPTFSIRDGFKMNINNFVAAAVVIGAEGGAQAHGQVGWVMDANGALGFLDDNIDFNIPFHIDPDTDVEYD